MLAQTLKQNKTHAHTTLVAGFVSFVILNVYIYTFF